MAPKALARLTDETVQMVHKSTKGNDKAPKRKHVRHMIIETFKMQGCLPFFHEFRKRPANTTAAVAFKILIVTHKLMQEGHPRCLEDAHVQSTYLGELAGIWRQAGEPDYSRLIEGYNNVLQDKILFHRQYPQFTGMFAVEEFSKKHASKMDDGELLKVANHLLDFCKNIVRMYNLVQESGGLRGVTECKISVLVPLIEEMWGMYQVIVFMLRRLHHDSDAVDVLQATTSRFYGLYPKIREFFFQTNENKFIKSVLAVPTLSRDPPRFAGMDPSELAEREAERKRKATEREAEKRRQAEEQARLQATQKQTTSQLLVETDDSLLSQRMRSQTTPLPFAEQQQPQQVQSNWVTFGSSGTGFEPAQPSMFSTSSSSKSTPLPDPEPVAAKSAEAQLPAEFTSMIEGAKAKQPTRELQESRKRVAELEARLQVSQEALHKHSAKDDSLQRLNEQLKKRVTMLEQALRKEIAKSRQLIGLVKERDAEIATLRKGQSDQLADLSTANDTLKAEREQLEVKTEQLERAKETAEAQAADMRRQLGEQMQALLRAECGAARDALEATRMRLDDPKNMGNEAATTETLGESAAALREAAQQVSTASAAAASSSSDSGGVAGISGVLAAMRGLGSTAATFMDDTKGVSRLSESPQTQEALMDAARRSMDALQQLLSAVGNAQDPASSGAVEGLAGALQSSAAAADRVLHESEAAAQAQDEAEDFDDLASRELMAAAKAISDAAERLKRVKADADAQSSTKSATQLLVTDAIMAAAGAITQATSALVQRAHESQQERVEQGRSQQGPRYKQDRTWAEGLISAAKAVAEAVGRLVQAADDTAQGEVQDEALIASAKAVSAATAQLVAASRAKADPNSKRLRNLESASGAVTRATRELVEAARAAAEAERAEADDETDMSSATFTGGKVKSFEQQCLILKLEKELQRARDDLGKMRRQEYATEPQTNVFQ